jgi:hypothetical protein
MDLSNDQQYFHDQHDNEICHGYFRKHWTKLLLATCRFAFSMSCITGSALLLNYFLELDELSRLLFRILLLGLFLVAIYEINKFFLKVLSWYLTIVILTDTRIVEVYKTVFFRDEKEVIDLRNVQDIQMKKVGFWRNLLGFGTIHLTLSTLNDSKEIKRVPNVSNWVMRFNQVRRALLFATQSNNPKSTEKLVNETAQKVKNVEQILEDNAKLGSSS